MGRFGRAMIARKSKCTTTLRPGWLAIFFELVIPNVIEGFHNIRGTKVALDDLTAGQRGVFEIWDLTVDRCPIVHHVDDGAPGQQSGIDGAVFVQWYRKNDELLLGRFSRFHGCGARSDNIDDEFNFFGRFRRGDVDCIPCAERLTGHSSADPAGTQNANRIQCLRNAHAHDSFVDGMLPPPHNMLYCR